MLIDSLIIIPFARERMCIAHGLEILSVVRLSENWICETLYALGSHLAKIEFILIREFAQMHI